MIIEAFARFDTIAETWRVYNSDSEEICSSRITSKVRDSLRRWMSRRGIEKASLTWPDGSVNVLERKVATVTP